MHSVFLKVCFLNLNNSSYNLEIVWFIWFDLLWHCRNLSIRSEPTQYGRRGRRRILGSTGAQESAAATVGAAPTSTSEPRESARERRPNLLVRSSAKRPTTLPSLNASRYLFRRTNKSIKQAYCVWIFSKYLYYTKRVWLSWQFSLFPTVCILQYKY